MNEIYKSLYSTPQFNVFVEGSDCTCTTYTVAAAHLVKKLNIASMENRKKFVIAGVVVVALVAVLAVILATTVNSGPPPPKTWINGDYKVGDINFAIVHIENDSIIFQQLKFLDSESDAVRPMTWVGHGENQVYISLDGETALATVSEDKRKISGGPGSLSLNNMTWISPEEADIIRKRPKEPANAPNVPYPLEPDNIGKIAFISGPPGSGKSTIAGILAKQHKWVYYEGDGFFLGFNPYVFPNESQVDARAEKPALIGAGMAARGGALVGFFFNQYQLNRNETTDRTPTEQYYELMAEDIKRERSRVGGNWVVVYAITKRSDRDVFRRVIGDDLKFVVLDISLELVKERLAGRGKGEEELAKEHWTYEPAQPDEPNTVGWDIKREATRQQNADGVFELIK